MIQNSTDSLWVDLFECALGKEWYRVVEPAIKAFPPIYDALKSPHKQRVVVICHSQGTIIMATVLRLLAELTPAEIRLPRRGGDGAHGARSARVVRRGAALCAAGVRLPRPGPDRPGRLRVLDRRGAGANWRSTASPIAPTPCPTSAHGKAGRCRGSKTSVTSTTSSPGSACWRRARVLGDRYCRAALRTSRRVGPPAQRTLPARDRALPEVGAPAGRRRHVRTV